MWTQIHERKKKLRRLLAILEATHVRTQIFEVGLVNSTVAMVERTRTRVFRNDF